MIEIEIHTGMIQSFLVAVAVAVYVAARPNDFASHRFHSRHRWEPTLVPVMRIHVYHFRNREGTCARYRSFAYAPDRPHSLLASYTHAQWTRVLRHPPFQHISNEEGSCPPNWHNREWATLRLQHLSALSRRSVPQLTTQLPPSDRDTIVDFGNIVILIYSRVVRILRSHFVMTNPTIPRNNSNTISKFKLRSLKLPIDYVVVRRIRSLAISYSLQTKTLIVKCTTQCIMQKLRQFKFIFALLNASFQFN